MKILCVFTDSHKILFDDYFIKTIPTPDNVIVNKLSIKGDGTYSTKSWQEAVTSKIRFVISYMKAAKEGEYFIFSDVDIQFFNSFDIDNLRKEILNSGMDVLFQKESYKSTSTKINSGFYIARSCKKLICFFEQVLHTLENSKIRNDQTCINNILESSNVKWGYLPPEYYARSHGFPPPDFICCHHANNAGKIEVKIKQLKFIRNYVESSYLRKKLIFFKFKINRNKKLLMKKIKSR